MLDGRGGSDYIDGRGGNDVLYGGTGYDRIYGGSGNDYLDGGYDRSRGSYDRTYDYLNGGTGADTYSLYVVDLNPDPRYASWVPLHDDGIVWGTGDVYTPIFIWW